MEEETATATGVKEQTGARRPRGPAVARARVIILMDIRRVASERCGVRQRS
jgi:hypothetical protein